MRRPQSVRINDVPDNAALWPVRKEQVGGNLLEADPSQAAYRPCQRCVIFGKVSVYLSESLSSI